MSAELNGSQKATSSPMRLDRSSIRPRDEASQQSRHERPLRILIFYIDRLCQVAIEKFEFFDPPTLDRLMWDSPQRWLGPLETGRRSGEQREKIAGRRPPRVWAHYPTQHNDPALC